MKITTAVLALLASSAVAQSPDPSPTPVPDGFNVSAQIGGTVSMSSAAPALLTPLARLSASGPLAIGSVGVSSLPVLHITGELSALPGDTIDQSSGLSGTLAQFKALDFSIGISKRVSRWLDLNNGKQSVATSVYVEAGFATRLDGEEKARDKAPRYGCLGLRFDERSTTSFIKTGTCLDQRLDGQYNVTVSIIGMVTPFEFGSGAGVSIYVRSILGIDSSSPTRVGLTGGNRDSVSVGTLVGWK